MIKIEVLADIQKATNNLVRLQEQAQTSFKKIETSVHSTNGILGNFSSKIGTIGKNFIGGLTIVAALDRVRAAVNASLDSFISYEKSLVGVGKTTNITGKQLDFFGKQIINLSKEIPVAANNLLGIAQAAGQLGVKGTDNLLNFTETVAKLGVATDLSGEQGATALVRILNVTNESIDKIDELGSVIVRLGNNFAATESEIVNSTTELARGTGQFGVASREAAALGATLQSLGVEAESGGTVITNAFIKIQESILKGGDGLRLLERITGQTSATLKKEFEVNALGVFQKFLDGLIRLDKDGVSKVANTLDQFGLTGARVSKVIPVLAQRTDILRDALNQANEEFSNATALNVEAAAAFATTSSQLQLFENSATAAEISIGEKLAPAFLVLKERVLAAKLAFAGLVESIFPPAEQTKLEDAGNKTKYFVQLLGEAQKKKDELMTNGFTTGTFSPELQEVNERIDMLKLRLKETTVPAMELIKTMQGFGGASLAAADQSSQANLKVIDGLMQTNSITLEQDKLRGEMMMIQLQEELDTKAAILEADGQNTLERTQRVQAAQKAILDSYISKNKISKEKAETINLNIEKKASGSRIALAEEEAKQKANRDMVWYDQEQTKKNWENMNLKDRASAYSSSLSTISTLTASSNKTLFTIGKSAAISQATVDGILAIQKTLAVIPPPAGFVMAGLMGVATAANVARIASQKPPSFATGGIVGGTSYHGDKVGINVNSGEMILNRDQQTALFNKISSDSDGGSLASAIHELGNRIMNLEIVLKADDIEIARSVNRAVSNGFTLARTA
jgi:TP901 family phage tail tape measure protein